MVRTLTNVSVALVLTTAAAAVYAQSAAVTEKDVLHAMYAVDQADEKRDKAALERLTADDFLYHASNGTVQTKAQSIADTMSGGSTWTARKYGGVKVRIYGDLAVITGTVTLLGKSTSYQAGPRLFTRLFIRRDGRWQDLGGQATLVPAK